MDIRNYGWPVYVVSMVRVAGDDGRKFIGHRSLQSAHPTKRSAENWINLFYPEAKKDKDWDFWLAPRPWGEDHYRIDIRKTNFATWGKRGPIVR